MMQGYIPFKGCNFKRRENSSIVFFCVAFGCLFVARVDPFGCVAVVAIRVENDRYYNKTDLL